MMCRTSFCKTGRDPAEMNRGDVAPENYLPLNMNAIQ